MIYVMNKKIGRKHFVNTDKAIEEFAHDLIMEIRQTNKEQWLNVSYGSDNVCISTSGNKSKDFDVWLYNENHPLYQDALLQNYEVVVVE